MSVYLCKLICQKTAEAERIAVMARAVDLMYSMLQRNTVTLEEDLRHFFYTGVPSLLKIGCCNAPYRESIGLPQLHKDILTN